MIHPKFTGHNIEEIKRSTVVFNNTWENAKYCVKTLMIDKESTTWRHKYNYIPHFKANFQGSREVGRCPFTFWNEGRWLFLTELMN